MKPLIASLLAVACLSGCASIVTGHNQTLSIDARARDSQVTDATCTLANDKGTWFVKTPGSVTVRRSFQDLSAKCEKDGISPGFASIRSSTKGMAFGNILFGGVIGAGVDIGTGAAYDYPALIVVTMGDSVNAPPSGANDSQQPAIPPAASAASAPPPATPVD